MKQSKRKELLFLIFPNLRLLKVSFDSVKCGYKVYKAYKNRKKMRFPVKLAIGSAIAFIFIFIVGFMVFPKMIKSKVKKMTALLPGNEIRGLFTKVPFALDFKIYMFNVTNPMEVQAGQKPKLRQVGPFCYQEWKSKVSILDNDEEDTMNYNPVDVFIAYPISDDCISGDTEVTILHPLIVGMVNTVNRQKPAMLNLVAKAIKSIYKDPQSVYLTAKAKDILFDSVVIDCSVKDFAGKAVCTQLRTEAKDLKHLSDTELGFSLLGPKNGTPGKTFKVYRGKKDSHDLGRILQYDGQAEMEIWPTKECNQIRGTDGTIFPPFLKAEEGLVSFAPDMCRSLAAVFDRKTKYDGIPVREYSATLGDMSKNADEKCYCLTPETCLKKGLMDLYKCVGLPLYISLPHFYESDVSYLNAVEGLSPQKDKHGIKILFEPTTGSPVYAKKRLQFSMPLEPIDKVPLFNNLPTLVHPIFWVEEGVELNITYTKQLKDFFKIMKIVKISKWVIILCSLAGLGAAGYLHFKKSGGADITPVHKVQPVNKGPDQQNGISRVGGFEGHVNHAMSENEIDKY